MSQRALGTWLMLGAVLLCGAVVLVVLGDADRDRTLPLADTQIIRAQAAQKDLDPALIAAVIYAESKFEPQPSSAGAEGLMQILPETAVLPGETVRRAERSPSATSRPRA